MDKLKERAVVTNTVKENACYMLGFIFGYIGSTDQRLAKELHEDLRNDVLKQFGVDIEDRFLL